MTAEDKRGAPVAARAADRARRLGLTSAIWNAGGIDDTIGLRTVIGELGGLAQELRMADLEPVAEALESAVEAIRCAEPFRRSAPPLQSGRRILVLDDTEVTGDLIAVALESIGCIVAVTSTLSDCIQRFIDFEPELILLEPTHPELEGMRSLDAFRKRLRASFVPVILFSASPEHELVRRAQHLEADGYLTKDHGIPQLVEKVAEILSEIVW
jgi:CheY-like chemotaxis protein